MMISGCHQELGSAVVPRLLVGEIDGSHHRPGAGGHKRLADWGQYSSFVLPWRRRSTPWAKRYGTTWCCGWSAPVVAAGGTIRPSALLTSMVPVGTRRLRFRCARSTPPPQKLTLLDRSSLGSTIPIFSQRQDPWSVNTVQADTLLADTEGVAINNRGTAS